MPTMIAPALAPTDRLDALLAHFSVSATMFHAGTLCGLNALDGQGEDGQMHLVRRGVVDVNHSLGTPALRIEQPSLLLYARPLSHQFVTDPVEGADLACARIVFDGAAAHPIAAALPSVVLIPLDSLMGAAPVLEALFEEAFNTHCGRRSVLDRLFEVVLVQVLRHLMEREQLQVGMLAGLAHPRLRQALVAMHDEPAQPWSLERLASTCGMSRSGFAETFRKIVGSAPGAYLQGWRIGLAQQALRKGVGIKQIAHAVGYGSEAALSRAFSAQTGMSPRRWLIAQRQPLHTTMLTGLPDQKAAMFPIS